jgi:hypothetical protein
MLEEIIVRPLLLYPKTINLENVLNMNDKRELIITTINNNATHNGPYIKFTYKVKK